MAHGRTALQAAALVAAAAAILTATRWLAGLGGLPLQPLVPQLAAWSVVVVVRHDAVQRLLGGGSLSGRPALRTAVGCATFFVALCTSGMPVLFPAAAALVASSHLLWSGARSSRTGALAAVLGTTAGQGAVAAGWVAQPLSPAAGWAVAGSGLLLALATTSSTGLLAAQRDAEAAALAVEQRRRSEELLDALRHDPLTGLLNRLGVTEHLARAAPAARPGAGTAVLFCDLDGFKAVNDAHGHEAGDRLLVAVAGRLRAALRPGDEVGRTGGDEFVAVLRGVTGAAEALRTARRLEDALVAPVLLDGAAVRVGVSVGSSWADGPADPEDLLRDADAAMYAAKRAHRAGITGSAVAGSRPRAASAQAR